MSTHVCSVCPHACKLLPGEIGLCGARQGHEEGVKARNYGCCTALAFDPIEKKPLARFYPGTHILSYGSFGCNLSCSFCQNWHIAQLGKRPGDQPELQAAKRYVSPSDLVEQALKDKRRGNLGIALTYNEPLVCPEYILDVADLAHAHDLKVVLVTNGYATPKVAEQIFTHVDAANIDLKAFNHEFYTKVGAPAGLSIVKKTIEIAVAKGCHVEVTTLVIPGLNDSQSEMAEEAAWLASLDPGIPLHISRFHPAYHMVDVEPTPRATITALERIARKNLSFVYTGNM